MRLGPRHYGACCPLGQAVVNERERDDALRAYGAHLRSGHPLPS
jgi:hypothetical protein